MLGCRRESCAPESKKAVSRKLLGSSRNILAAAASTVHPSTNYSYSRSPIREEDRPPAMIRPRASPLTEFKYGKEPRFARSAGTYLEMDRALPRFLGYNARFHN
ncbi:hypothetical protein HPB50_022119 [Hyalomma asiaticum]|uniref:Uncharacterized protein n=1 Tax=Hyalomma asiaticum TaxID=266040 RepID=A0ACB7RYM9_HYAAI|nr:hypothetical protein HPB50_022119 [Hyalomma asiaticum]